MQKKQKWSWRSSIDPKTKTSFKKIFTRHDLRLYKEWKSDHSRISLTITKNKPTKFNIEDRFTFNLVHILFKFVENSARYHQMNSTCENSYMTHHAKEIYFW
jgi:hypothetical protein